VTHWSPLDGRYSGGNNETVIALPEPASKPQFIPPLFLYLIPVSTFIYVLPLLKNGFMNHYHFVTSIEPIVTLLNYLLLL
jgi:hypothetical protein